MAPRPLNYRLLFYVALASTFAEALIVYLAGNAVNDLRLWNAGLRSPEGAA